MLIAAVPIGLLIGLALGALGGGGSILTVPALVYLLHQTPHAATTGSLLIVGVTALAGMAAHARAGRVRFGEGAAIGLLGIAGSYAGTRISASVDPDLLLSAFAGLMIVAAAAMLRRQRGHTRIITSQPKEEIPTTVAAGATARACTGTAGRTQTGARAATAANLPAGETAAWRPDMRMAANLPAGETAAWRPDMRMAVKVAAAATTVGLLTGFFGVGGGFVIVPALVLALGFEMPVAVGTSLLVIAINSAAALLARLGGHAHFDWPVLALFTVAAACGAVAGHHIGSRVQPARLTAAFTALLFAVALYIAARSVPHLA